MAPLLQAIHELPTSRRPFRIVSHEAEDGRVFNSTFFESAGHASEFLDWYDTNALQPSGRYHPCLSGAIAPGTELPTGNTLLFGRGAGVLDDTRFGEYQLGMAVRYSLATFHSAEMEREAVVTGTSSAFEQRLANAMMKEGIAYFGRLVMRVDEKRWITLSRYGSLPEAHAGTALVRTLCAEEMAHWFSSYETIIGTASRVLDI